MRLLSIQAVIWFVGRIRPDFTCNVSLTAGDDCPGVAGDIATWKILETEEQMSKEEMKERGLDVFMEVYLLLTPKNL